MHQVSLLIRKAAILLVLSSACRGAASPPAARNADPAAAAPGSTLLVTPRLGAVAFDTARLYMAGPLFSTAGWRSFVVSYETNVRLDDSVALAAQADSVFAHVRGLVDQRPDTTAFMEAHVAAGNAHSGYRFLYHKLPDGSWERVP